MISMVWTPMVMDVATGAMDRAGLSATIADALEAGSLLLIADAGYGKTTALRQGLRRGGLNAAWVRCGDATWRRSRRSRPRSGAAPS